MCCHTLVRHGPPFSPSKAVPPTLEHMNVDRKWLKKTGGDQSWKKTLKKKGLGMYGELHEVVMKSQRYGDDGVIFPKYAPP